MYILCVSGFLKMFILLFGERRLGPHPVMLRFYSWFCALRLLLAELRKPKAKLENKLEVVPEEQNLSPVLSLWSQHMLFCEFIILVSKLLMIGLRQTLFHHQSFSSVFPCPACLSHTICLYERCLFITFGNKLIHFSSEWLRIKWHFPSSLLSREVTWEGKSESTPLGCIVGPCLYNWKGCTNLSFILTLSPDEMLWRGEYANGSSGSHLFCDTGRASKRFCLPLCLTTKQTLILLAK